MVTANAPTTNALIATMTARICIAKSAQRGKGLYDKLVGVCREGGVVGRRRISKNGIEAEIKGIVQQEGGKRTPLCR
jgi:hypothetical protein